MCDTLLQSVVVVVDCLLRNAQPLAKPSQTNTIRQQSADGDYHHGHQWPPMMMSQLALLLFYTLCVFITLLLTKN